MALLVIRLVSLLVAALPTPALLGLGSVLGWIWYHLIPVRRRDALHAVARAFPDKPPAEHQRIVKANFVHLIRSLLEVVAFVSYPVDRLKKLVRFEGLIEPVLAARAEGKGTVCLSAHIGSFELSMGTFHFLTNGVPIVIVARLPKAGFARALLDAVRERTGMVVLPPKGSLPKVVHAITEEKRIFGFVTDQNMPKKRGVFVDFLGEIACTTPGFSVIARKSGGIVIAGWNERLADGTHLGHFGPPITLSSDPNPRVAALNDTWRVSQLTEQWIRNRPEQWFWVHRRWKSKPDPGEPVRTVRGLEVWGKGRVGVLLDRDGTINFELGHSVHSPDEVVLVPGAAEGIRRLNEAGVAVLVTTNQASVGRGQIDETTLEQIHQRMAELLAKEGARVDGIYYCPHHPTEGKGAFLKTCDCRKPLPGLLNQATKEWGLNPGVSLFVGDRDTDVKAARAAGYPVTLVTNGWSHKPWEAPVEPADDTSSSLADAVDRFLERRMGKSE